MSTSRELHLWNDFKMHVEEYEEIWKSQGEVCAICYKPQEGEKHFHVDHCHYTDKIRGILCSNCNTGLGLFQNNPSFLIYASDYLETADTGLISKGRRSNLK